MGDLELKALVLAAGVGSRLRPITDKIPKCLVPIQGKPLLGFWLEMLEAESIPVLINTHHFSNLVESFARPRYPESLLKIVFEEELLGTGGTLLKNADFFAGSAPTLLVHADNLSRFSLREFYDAHQRRPAGCVMTMMIFDSPTPQTCGIVKLNHRGVVEAFYEKVENPPGNLANAAVYILETEVIEFLKTLGKNKIDFSTEVLPAFLGRIFTYHNKIYHRDIGTPESLAQAEVEWTMV